MGSLLRTGMTLIVIALTFLAFNLVWLGKLPNPQWDFSQQGIHSPPAPIKRWLNTLEHPVDLYYFNAHNAPNRTQTLNRHGKRIEQRLKDYEKRAKGMINLHVIDPRPFSEDAYKASLYGLSEDMGFLGLIGTRAGVGVQRIESLRLDHEPLLDYEISHLIYKLQHPERPSVGLLSGIPLGEPAGRLLGELRRHLAFIDLQPTGQRVPEQLKALMVVQPSLLPESALYEIEQFVLKGGKLLMFIDPLSEQRTQAAPDNPRVGELLAAWGLHMPERKVLIDSLYGSTPAPGLMKPGIPALARLNLPRQAMNKNDVSTWRLNTVAVSSSGVLSPLNGSAATFTPLLQGSWQAVLREVALLEPITPMASSTDRVASPVIAARIEGPAYSIFPDGLKGQPPGVQKVAQIQVVVVADTDLLMDQDAGAAPTDNALFILNTLDNLSALEPLASLRPRAPPPPSANLLGKMREDAEHAYRAKAIERERRLQETEQQWRRLNPATLTLGSQAVDTSTQLQALNKERLRLPIELHALRADAYAQVRHLERTIKLVVILAVPLMLCLVAWLLHGVERRRRVAFDNQVR